MNPVSFRWKWGEDELPIVDQYTYLVVEISMACFWDANIAKATGKGKAAWEGNANFVKQLEAVQIAADKDSRMLKYDEKYSIKSRGRNVPT